MASPFIPRAVFPVLDSLPRSYYLGHHAAGLSKMRSMLNQIDLVVECRDYRLPLTSRNPMFEEALADAERIVVYTKSDLGRGDDGSQESGDEKVSRLLRQYLSPYPVRFSNHKSIRDIRSILDLIKKKSAMKGRLTGVHCMVVGMPNVGKSSLLNSLRNSGMHKGKVAHTGAQPGVTRKIGTAVKIFSGSTDKEKDDHCPVYLLDTPGVFVPYVPDSDAMLKLALCGSVKDTVVPPFILADYLLFHVNLHNPRVYAEYHDPTNDITQLLDAMARKTGRLQRGGTPDLEGTALWMVQRWRNGHLGIFMLDEVSEHAIEQHRALGAEQRVSMNQARKARKIAAKEKLAEKNTQRTQSIRL